MEVLLIATEDFLYCYVDIGISTIAVRAIFMWDHHAIGERFLLL
jgi:hypothetical protein